jgi:hypothetical protein
MLEDVYDCFQRAESGDYGYEAGENPWYCSKGINNDWVDSYDELKDRDFAPNGYRRSQRWCTLAGIDSDLLQVGSIDHLRVEAYDYDEEGKVRERGGGGLSPAIFPFLPCHTDDRFHPLGVLSAFFPSLSLETREDDFN